MDIKILINDFNEIFTFYCVFPAMAILGLYLTIRLKCVQISKLKLSLSCLLKKEEKSEGSLSQYQALAAVLAGNFGAGNIPGMAVAITTGGPGALVWMWIIAFLGAAIQYASCLLGGKFSRLNEEKECVGGPMYYLSEGLGFKKLAFLFAFFTVIASLTVGNVTQVNSVLLPLHSLGVPPLITAFTFTFLTSIVMLGGIKRFASVVSSIVPVMAIMYLGATIIILFLNADEILPALKIMFNEAFDYNSLIGGTLGLGTVKAITSGFDRGLFATDAGTGLVPILQSNAKSKHPVINGVVTLVAPFLVMIVCTGTGLVLIITGAWQEASLVSTNMVTWAFNQGLNSSIGAYIVMVALMMFAYTTILAWASCAERAISFLWGLKNAHLFRYFFIGIIPFSILVPDDLVWVLSDISISLMLATNIIGVAFLSKHVISESSAYFELKKLREA